ncbi:MAG: hypothetical protein OEV08_03470 [Nitrospira sp.]|nr:hypothetical protein [Nitrospira sp.]
MADHDPIQRELRRIRTRSRAFWVTICGGLLLTIFLIPINQGAANAAGLIWVILSIATWMSPMMAICPHCHKNFHERTFPSWRLNPCANCGLSLDSEIITHV